MHSPRRAQEPRHAALWGALLIAGSLSCARARAPRHLVVVVIDTLRADHLGAYGYARGTSPRLDALASEGTLFTEAEAQSDWTVPATASLLTSLYPSRHGAVVEGELKHLGEAPVRQLHADVETLGPILRRAGMRTALLSANPYLHGRLQQGFDLVEVARQDAAALTGQAIRWFVSRPDEPAYLHLQYMDLHQPISPPEPYRDLFPAEAGGARGPEHAGWAFGRIEDDGSEGYRRFRDHKIALYDGALHYVDDQIGRLVDALADAGMLDETLLMVTSDHGEELWDHWREGRRLGGDPRGLWGIGHGHTMFQELLHVPLIVRGPGVAEGRRVTCAVRHLDVAPTALALLGVDAPIAMQGVSLEGLLRSERAECRDVAQVAESPAYGPDSRAVVWRGFKLIERADGVRMLFDLRRDPGEHDDLIAREPALAERLLAKLREELSADGERPPGEPMELDPETEEQLRALGYL